MSSNVFKPCVIIPVYNHEHAIGVMVNAVLAHDLPCILIDDGSATACANVLTQIAAATPDRVTLLRHPRNRGKGGAIVTGFRHAAEVGYSHALQIDADGQHCADDIPHFLKLAAEHPAAIIIGCPEFDKSVPKARFYARYLTHVWVWINTLSFDIKDSMCGFRVYPLPALIALAQQKKLCEHMDFDSEVLVRLHWQGIAMINTPTRIVYPADGVSHFRMVLDNLLIARMHATLFFGMLLRAPFLLARKLNCKFTQSRVRP